MQDVAAPNREEALAPPTQSRKRGKRRLGSLCAGLIIGLGVGWIAGLNAHRYVDVDQTSTLLRQQAAYLQSASGSAWLKASSWIETLSGGATSEAKPDLAVTTTRARVDILEHSSQDLSSKVYLLQGAAENSGRDVSNLQQSHRDVLAKLNEVGERLERLERQIAAVPSSSSGVQPPPVSPPKPVVQRPAAGAKANLVPKPDTARSVAVNRSLDRGPQAWPSRN